METRETNYARAADGAYIAYQTVGDGPIDIAWQFDWLGNVDAIWDARPYAEWFRGLASFARLILHDRRGTGASSRSVGPPNLETRVADFVAVLDAVGSERPVLGAALEGGAPNVLVAATMPDRVHSLFWWYPAPRSEVAPDYPWGVGSEELERNMREIAEGWGTAAYDEPGSPGIDAIPWSLSSRQTSTPDAAVEMELIWRQTDVRRTLPAVTAPTLLLARDRDREALDHLESLMPNAHVKLFPGSSRLLPLIVEQPMVLRAIKEFIGVEAPAPELDTVLSTVLFTDIVGSTERQASLGDRGWKALVERHHALVRESLNRWRGVENDTAGDGFYATFDGPARAIRCALDIADRIRALDLEIRAGVHTGECHVIDGKIGGISVVTGSRIAAIAGPSQTLISQTVKDLVAGSGLTFEDAGEHELKGVPDRWHLYRVVS
jgi:class 3 adenylate cyclase/pimeloyl-ACP methyl ester carboxylesterase